MPGPGPKAYDPISENSPIATEAFLEHQSTAVRLCWNAIRVPVLGAPLFLEPAVRIICSCALVGVLRQWCFELSPVSPSRFR